jgi:hypothetical protein
MYRIPLGSHKENPPPSPKTPNHDLQPLKKNQPDATAIDWPDNIATDWPDTTATDWPNATATDWTGPRREHPSAAPSEPIWLSPNKSKEGNKLKLLNTLIRPRPKHFQKFYTHSVLQKHQKGITKNQRLQENQPNRST